MNYSFLLSKTALAFPSVSVIVLCSALQQFCWEKCLKQPHFSASPHSSLMLTPRGQLITSPGHGTSKNKLMRKTDLCCFFSFHQYPCTFFSSKWLMSLVQIIICGCCPPHTQTWIESVNNQILEIGGICFAHVFLPNEWYSNDPRLARDYRPHPRSFLFLLVMLHVKHDESCYVPLLQCFLQFNVFGLTLGHVF